MATGTAGAVRIGRPAVVVPVAVAAVALAAWWLIGADEHAGAPAPGLAAQEQDHDHGLGLARLAAAFAGLAGRRELTPGFAALALLAALALGAGHALAPGHGKLMMATYLVNERGTLRQAASVAGTVAATHTAGVLALGVLLAAGLHFAPHRVYTLLTALSGALVIAVGISLLRRAWRDHAAAAPAHAASALAGHGDPDGHGGCHGHGHGHGPRPPGVRGVVAIGLAGGLMPSPSAVVVLLGAVALGRAWYGVLLVAAYGAGMALSLLTVGLLLTRLRDRLARAPRAWTTHRAWRLLPVFTSSVVIVVGVGVATTALLA
ncbi:hypothetical protein [Catellatospora sp. NPDC049609]|uniref:hypothetical protein n=1 Tax=Catellatospora sp. NPDC049609 TaxID=3155505 RepID=UPI00342C385B